MNKWNKFTKTIFIGLLLLLLAIIGIFLVGIYDPPKIRFITSNEQSYQAENHFQGYNVFATKDKFHQLIKQLSVF